MKDTIFYNTVCSSLVLWHNFDNRTVNEFINSKSIEELDSITNVIIFLHSSLKGIVNSLGLEYIDENIIFMDKQEIKNTKFYEELKNKTSEELSIIILNAITSVHNDWVKIIDDNKTYLKKIKEKELRQYVPLELIGFNEVESDYVFVSPFFEIMDININIIDIKKEYYKRVNNYFDKMNINSELDIVNLIKTGNHYYDSLDKEMAFKLSDMSAIVVEQIIKNWKDNDTMSLELFENRKKHIQ